MNRINRENTGIVFTAEDTFTDDLGCIKCGAKTNHKSGECKDCRTKACRDCGVTYISNKGFTRCNSCLKKTFFFPSSHGQVDVSFV